MFDTAKFLFELCHYALNVHVCPFGDYGTRRIQAVNGIRPSSVPLGLAIERSGRVCSLTALCLSIKTTSEQTLGTCQARSHDRIVRFDKQCGAKVFLSLPFGGNFPGSRKQVASGCCLKQLPTQYASQDEHARTEQQDAVGFRSGAAGGSAIDGKSFRGNRAHCTVVGLVYWKIKISCSR